MWTITCDVELRCPEWHCMWVSHNFLTSLRVLYRDCIMHKEKQHKLLFCHLFYCEVWSCFLVTHFSPPLLLPLSMRMNHHRTWDHSQKVAISRYLKQHSRIKGNTRQRKSLNRYSWCLILLGTIFLCVRQLVYWDAGQHFHLFMNRSCRPMRLWRVCLSHQKKNHCFGWCSWR